MSTSIEIMKELVHRLEQYQKENQNKDLTMESFILWLNSKLFTGLHGEKPAQHPELLDMELSFLLVLQIRFYKAYAKRVLGESELSSPDGFSFLYHLRLVDSYRKMELIKMHQLEPPSGIEVLKRLLNKKFIEEFDDTMDKRAKRIRITEMGIRELEDVMPKMKKVFRYMTAEMSLHEKLLVISFLKQMNDFHDMHASANKQR